MFGLLAGMLFVLSFHSKWVRERLERITYFLVYISVFSVSFTLFKSNLDPIWSTYHIALFFGLSAVFRNLKWFGIHVILYSIGTIAAVMFVSDPAIDTDKFIFIYSFSAAIMIVVAYSYTWTIQKIEHYAYHNAHELRAPVARIQGLLELESMDISSKYLDLLKKEAEDLDKMTRKSQKILE